MIKVLESKSALEYIPLEMPVRWVSELSHVRNIEYCIAQLEHYGSAIKEPVIGYFVVDGAAGTRHAHYQILPRGKAEEMIMGCRDFNYLTREDFRRKERKIKEGRYKLHNGLVAGLRPKISDAAGGCK